MEMKMMENKKLYAIILIAVITVAILVPVLLLTRHKIETTLGISIVSPTNTTYISQNPQITVNLNVQGSNIDTVCYRIYNETGSAWVDSTNLTWIGATIRNIGQGGVYILYAWVNNSLGMTQTANQTFTVIREYLIDVDTVFANSWTIGEYQKYILRDADFSFSSGFYLIVNGILEIDNATWSSILYIDANSAVSGTNTTFGANVNFYGEVIAIMDSVTMQGNTFLYGDANVSFYDATFINTLYAYDNSTLTITNTDLYYTYLRENSQATISYSTGYYIGIQDEAVGTLINYTADSGGDMTLQDNATLTAINSTWDDLYRYSELYSGIWAVDYNILSGIGSYQSPKVVMIDSNYDQSFNILSAFDSTQLLINHSTYTEIYLEQSSNGTIDLSTVSSIYVRGNANGLIMNTTSTSLELSTNETVELENFTTGVIRKTYTFYQGTISGYNETFTGIESASFPKIIYGPNTIYGSLQYRYYVNNEVNFTLRDTHECNRVEFIDNTNGSIIHCTILAQLLHA
jgi:hypothetical protein